jgi:hypothetical protein
MSTVAFEQRRQALRCQLAEAAAKGWRYVLKWALLRGASPDEIARIRVELEQAEREAKP